MGKQCGYPLTGLPRFAWNLIPRALFLAPALLAASLAMPSTVRAECGDYVMRGSTHGAAPEPLSSPAAEQSGAVRHLPFRQQEPCRGPHCSQGTPPLTMPVSTVPSKSQEWGSASEFGVLQSDQAAAYVCEDSLQQSAQIVSSIFHPPRMNSPCFSL